MEVSSTLVLWRQWALYSPRREDYGAESIWLECTLFLLSLLHICTAPPTTFMLCDYDVLYQLHFRHSSYLARFLWSHSGTCLKWCLCVYLSSYNNLQLEYTSFTPCVLLQCVLYLWQKWLQAWTRNYSYRMIVGRQKLACYSSENDTLLIRAGKANNSPAHSLMENQQRKACC